MSKSPLSGLKISIIGTGNMGQALIRGLVEKSVYPQNISVYDVDAKKITAVKKIAPVKVAKNERASVSLADVVILAVKPQMLGQVANDIQSAVSDKALIVSIAAGVPIKKLESFFKKPMSIIRVMPNMPAQVGQGMACFSLGRHATAKHRDITEAVLNAFGESLQVPEKMLDLVTAISGSGPAYYFLLSEKLIAAAYEMGMKVDAAKKLVYQTAFGSGKVMKESPEDPDVLISKVASKGGTTEAALKIFQKKGFGKIIEDAVKAAYKRSVELSKGVH